MRTPFRASPQTTPTGVGLAQLSSAHATPSAYGAQLGESLRGIGQSLQGLHERLQQETAQQSEFQVQRQLIDETLATQLDMQQRRVDAPLGAVGFTDQVAEDYETRHAGLLQELREAGVEESIVQSAELRLAELRRTIVTQAADFQLQSHELKLATDVSDVGTQLTQLVSMNPFEFEAAREEWHDIIDNLPGIDAFTRERMRSEFETSIALAAGQGLATQYPETVVDLLTSGQDEGDYFDRVRTQESGGSDAARNPLSSATGRYQFIESTWNELVDAHPEAGLTRDGRLDPAQQEIAIRLFTQANSNVLQSAGIAPSHANLYAAHFLGAGGATTVLKSPDGTPLSQILSSGVMNANPHLRGMDVGDFKAWTQRAVGSSTSAPIDGQTGNAVLDALDAGQRQTVLNAARTEMNRKQAAARGDLEYRVTNAEAAYLTTGEFDGRTPTAAEFFAAYDPLEAQQRWAAFDNTRQIGEYIQGFKTQSADDIASVVATMEPGDTASPTYATDLASYEQAQTAAANILKQREQDPAGYVMQNYPAVADAWDAIYPSENPSGQRQAAYAQMQEAYTQLGMRPSQMLPIPVGQVDAYVERFNAQPPEIQVEELVGLRREMGDLYGNGLQQLAENGMPVPAYLSGLVMESPEHQGVAANVLRGMKIISENPSLRPSAEQTAQEFRDAMGESQLLLPPAAAGAALDAARALYIFEGGDPQEIDRTQFNTALRQVLGGFADDTQTGLVDMRPDWLWGFGRNNDIEMTILPPGINRDQFQSWQESLLPEDLINYSQTTAPIYDDGDQTPVTAQDIMEDGVFVKVAPGQYIIKMSSDGLPLVDSAGNYYVMNLTSEMFR